MTTPSSSPRPHTLTFVDDGLGPPASLALALACAMAPAVVEVRLVAADLSADDLARVARTLRTVGLEPSRVSAPAANGTGDGADAPGAAASTSDGATVHLARAADGVGHPPADAPLPFADQRWSVPRAVGADDDDERELLFALGWLRARCAALLARVDDDEPSVVVE